MAKTGKRQGKAVQTRRQQVQPQQVEIDREQWMKRRKRNTVLAFLVAVAAIVASLGYAIHNAIGRIDTAVASELGPTTASAPSAALGHFKPIGTELKKGGKPEVMMIGTLSCEYCAAERWALVKALGRFGTWSNLNAGTNGAGIPTFNLVDTKYSSWYISLVHKDLQDLNGDALQTLTAREHALYKKYDPQGVTPLLIVGKYALVGQGVDPAPMIDRDFRSVQISLIKNETTGYTGPINAEANLITAMLCRADAGNPSVFCGRPEIKRIASKLQ
jgi:uncharacterized protein DUF929